MIEGNLSEHQRNKIANLDEEDLKSKLSDYIEDRKFSQELSLIFSEIGPFIAQRFNLLQENINLYNSYNSPQKRESNYKLVQKSLDDLIFAIRTMKRKVKIIQENEELFHVDFPFQNHESLTQHLKVVVHYRWRTSALEDWKFSRITFLYTLPKSRQSYLSSRPKGHNNSHSKLKELNLLHQTWNYLAELAFTSVNSFLEADNDGGRIPHSFAVPAGQLTNQSTDFWHNEGE